MSVSMSARRGAAALATGLLLGVVPGLVSGEAAHAAAPTATAISITASPARPVSGAALTLVARLGVANKTVTFFGQVRGQRAVKLGSAVTDGSGTVAVQGKATFNATFTVTFAGDATHGSSKAATNVTVPARVSAKSSGGKKKSGFRLYKAGKKAKTSTTVAPSKAGKKVTFRLQKLVNGTWKAFGTKTVKLNKKSKASLTHVGKANSSYRARVEYRGDKLNAANVSPWRYEVFK